MSSPPGNCALEALGGLAGDLVAVEAEEDDVVAAVGLEVHRERAPVARRHHLGAASLGVLAAQGELQCWRIHHELAATAHDKTGRSHTEPRF